MPTGPKGEKRPAEANKRAVMTARIATGEIEDDLSESEGKNPAAVVLGRRGGVARAAALGSRKRVEIAREAALKRWAKKKRR